MKKLLSFLLAVCTLVTVGVTCSACGKTSTDSKETYTVTEEEWKTNFNLTKGQTTPTPLSVSLTKVSEITSYTIFAEGESEGTTGTSLLKVAPDGMSIEFYIGDTLREGESGTYASSDEFYIGLTTSIMSYFPFANNYDDFEYNEDEKAYISEQITSELNDEYDVNEKYYVYTKEAKVTFINGYLNTVYVELCDETFTDVYATFTFTFTNINKTTVTVE